MTIKEWWRLRKAYQFSKQIEEYNPPDINKDVREKYVYIGKYYVCTMNQLKLIFTMILLIIFFLHFLGVYDLWQILRWLVGLVRQ
jgi:hypothetical protein